MCLPASLALLQHEELGSRDALGSRELLCGASLVNVSGAGGAQAGLCDVLAFACDATVVTHEQDESNQKS